MNRVKVRDLKHFWSDVAYLYGRLLHSFEGTDNSWLEFPMEWRYIRAKDGLRVTITVDEAPE
jgi:hypothetical protein